MEDACLFAIGGISFFGAFAAEKEKENGNLQEKEQGKKKHCQYASAPFLKVGVRKRGVTRNFGAGFFDKKEMRQSAPFGRT